MAKRIIKKAESNIKPAKRAVKSETVNRDAEKKNDLKSSITKSRKVDFEVENIEFLLQQTLSHWKENLDSENIKADTIGDLEKLIKLRLLLIDENEQKRITAEKIMISVIAIIKEVIEDPAMRIKLLTRLKEIELIDSGEKS